MSGRKPKQSLPPYSRTTAAAYQPAFSGSLLKELQNMSQYKTASCLVGRRHQEEQRRTYPERANFYKLAAQAAGKGLDFTSKHNPEAEVFALRGKAQNNR